MESIAPEVNGTKGKGAHAAGRKDKNGPAVMQPKVLMKGIPELVKLKKAAEAAKVEYDDAKTSLAEKSGFLTETVERRVRAECKDKLEEEKRKVEQLAIAFEVEED